MFKIVKALESVSEWTGRIIAWLTLGMVLVTFAVVVMRYLLDLGSVALQESVTYMHAIVFMMGAAFTLKHGEHVRVDIFYARFSPRQRAWVDMLGTLLLLLPVCIAIFYLSWKYVALSWRIEESSNEPGGLIVYPLKSLLLIMPALLGIQALADLLKYGGFLLGKVPCPYTEKNIAEGEHHV